jgi:cysteine synthase A
MATPLTEASLGGFPLLLKREEFTPSGSHKDRPTRLIAQSLRDGGKFRPVGGKKPLFLLSSSGNFGNGLAYHTQDDPIDLVVVTDVLSPVEARDALRAYHHVRLEVIDQPDESGSHLKARQELLAQYLRHDPSATVVDQYGDRRVPLAYELTLAREIDEQTGGEVAAVFLPVGTGGLVNGLLKYAVKNRRRWSIFAADARGSRLFWDCAGARRRFPGFGNGRRTALIEEVSSPPYAFHVVHVDDRHTAATCHRLRKQPNLLLGPSGGATMAAVELVLRHCPELIPNAGHVVAIIADSGRKYLSTLYDDSWLRANGLGRLVS